MRAAVCLIYVGGASGVGVMTGSLSDRVGANIAVGVGLLAWSALTLLFTIAMRVRMDG